MNGIRIFAAGLMIITANGASAQDTLRVTDGLSGMVDRYLTEIARQHWEARTQTVARITGPSQVKQRQEYIHRKILDSLGGLPARTPLNAHVTGTLQREGYRVEKVIYESQPQFFVTANLYIPTTGKAPYPAVLGAAGHSVNGKAQDLYQTVWISLAKKGFVVLAYDPPGQGERYEYFDAARNKPKYPSTTEHSMSGMQCLLTGTNYARHEIWDGIRGVDYLLTRPEVDPRRIAAAGNSGGGTQTAYLQVLEPRLAVATPSCYLTAWEKLWLVPGPQDAEQDFSGFLKDELDFPDFLIAFAPKPVKMMTAVRDFFPIEGARTTFAEAKRIYEVMGAGERIAFFEYDDTHGWSKPRREATYQWLQQWLNHNPHDDGEPEIKIEPDANLNCTPTGQVVTSLKGNTIQSLNAKLADEMYSSRTVARLADPAKVRATVAARIGLDTTLQVPRVSSVGNVQRQNYRIEKITLETEKGISVPALVFVPEAGGARKPGVIVVNAQGKSVDAGPGGDLEMLAASGHIVLAPDLRGLGESASPKGNSGYEGSFQTSMRAILLGKTLVGMQTADLLQCFRYLASRADVNPSRIAVIGKGNAGVVAIYAAAFEPRIQKAAAEGSIPSYMSLALSKEPPRTAIEIAVPGVLRDFDLPDLHKLISPRPLSLVERTPGQSFAAAYGDWLTK